MGNKSKDTKQTPKNRNQIIILVLALVILGICTAVIVVQFSGSRDHSTLTLAKNREVSVADAYQLYQDGVYFLDVRTPIEYQSGHVPGATLIPLDELGQRAGELPVGEPILIYCRSGNRSLEAMNLLGSIGFMNLSSMNGGMQEWVIDGYPIEGGF